MILSLATPHGPEVWINQKMAETIEDAFRTCLSTEVINYYYVSCEGDSVDAQCHCNHKFVWLGPIGLIEYIKKVQHTIRNRYNAPVLGVTSCKSKGELEVYMETGASFINDHPKDYWIGDCDRSGRMTCGDELFVCLWDRVWQKATEGSTTKKRSLGLC